MADMKSAGRLGWEKKGRWNCWTPGPESAIHYSFVKTVYEDFPELSVEQTLGNILYTNSMASQEANLAITQLRSLIEAEKATEIAFLSKFDQYSDYLGFTPSALYGAEDWKSIINMINTIFNNSGNLKRTLRLMEKVMSYKKMGTKEEGTGKGRLDITRSFDFYLTKAFKEMGWKISENSEQQAYNRFKRALLLMSQAEQKASFGEEREFFNLVEELVNSEPGTTGAAALDQLIGSLMKTFFDDYKTINELKKKGTSTLYEHISAKSTAGASTAQEGLVTAIVNAFGMLNGSNGDISWKSLHSGSTGQKADNILYYGTLSAEARDILMENYGVSTKSTRVENIDRMKKFFDLCDAAKGEIVFISDKNYSISAKNFKGFTAQDNFKLSNFESFLGKIGVGNIEEIIWMLANYGSNGIVDDIDPVRSFISAKIADFLFDDISIEAPSAGGKAVHIMNLSGVFIPLSFILNRTLIALDSVANLAGSAEGMVSVSVSGKPAYEKKNHKLEESDWSEYRSQRMNSTTINVRFFQSFLTAMLDLLNT